MDNMDKKIKTFLLRWNPEISSWSKADFEADFGKGCYDAFYDFAPTMNWSIYEWDKLEEGDEFFMVTTGDDEQARIVMHGVFITHPYRSGNWREDSPKLVCHYADFVCITAFHPDSEHAIRISEIRSIIPDYDFGHGHAGVVIDDYIADVLRNRVARKRSMISKERMKDGFYIPRALPSTLVLPLEDERMYLQSSEMKLEEGFVLDAEDKYQIKEKAVVAPDLGRLWDTFWDLAEDGFQGRRTACIVEVEEFMPILMTEHSSLDELKSRLSEFRYIIENDCLVRLRISDSRGRYLEITFEKEIAIGYGRRADISRKLQAMGFSKRSDILLFYSGRIDPVLRRSVFGASFSTEAYEDMASRLSQA